MKITVIGFCGGYPKAGEATAGYLIQQDNFSLLIDCGSGVLSKMQHYIAVEDLNAVIISHYHHDHVADIGPLQFGRLINVKIGKTSPVLPVYGHDESESDFKRLTMKSYTVGMPFNEKSMINLGAFEISFCRTIHPVTCFAIKVKSGNSTLVYTGDGAYCEKLVKFSTAADLLLCECNFYADQDGSKIGHMNSIDAGNLAHKAGVKELILTHLPHYGDNSRLLEESASVFRGKLELAKFGLIREL